MFTESNSKSICKSTGIRVSIMNRHHCAQLQFIVAEMRDNARLDEVVVRNTVVALSSSPG